MNTIDYDELILEWSTKVPSGIPSIENDQESLREILTERGLDEEVIGELLMEISVADKNYASSLVSTFLKNALSTSAIIDFGCIYPPRSVKIRKDVKGITVKTTFECTKIDNNQREECFDAFAKYCNIHRKPVRREKNASEMNSSIGYLNITLEKNIHLFLAFKGTKKLVAGNASDTDIKEGLVTLFFQTPNLQILTKDNFRPFIKTVIHNENYRGEAPEKIVKIKEFLKKQDGSPLSIKFLNQTISQALAFKDYKGYLIDRDKIFTRIRQLASSITKVPADKWCPADLYLINPKKAKEINATISKIGTIDTDVDKLKALNDLFENEWGAKEAPIVGISLKLQVSQGGKAKDFLKTIDPADKTYNISSDEIKLNQSEIAHRVHKLRAELKHLFKNTDIQITYHPPSDTKELEKSKDRLMTKYGALKLFNFLLKKGDRPADEMILAATAFGLSLSGINPTYFKCVASKSGETNQPDKFSAGTVITLYPAGIEHTDATIDVYDVNSNGGIAMIFAIEKGESICDVRLTARSNGYTQITLEIEKITCRHYSK